MIFVYLLLNNGFLRHFFIYFLVFSEYIHTNIYKQTSVCPKEKKNLQNCVENYREIKKQIKYSK